MFFFSIHFKYFYLKSLESHKDSELKLLRQLEDAQAEKQRLFDELLDLQRKAANNTLLRNEVESLREKLRQKNTVRN